MTQITGQRPIILGIVGDSAAGKTTLTKGLVHLLGEERVTHVCSDDYHKYDRRERAQLNITALHPDCNYLDVVELHLERLHYGQPILKPVYDHSTGSLVRPSYTKPLEFVIVEGLLGYHSAVMRQFYDVKVYLDPPEDLRRVWKIRRDTTKRGYIAEQVLAELEKREPDSRDFIRPQREFADIIVRFYPSEGVTPEGANGHLNVRLILRPTIPHPDLSYLFDNAQSQLVALDASRQPGVQSSRYSPPNKQLKTRIKATRKLLRKAAGSSQFTVVPDVMVPVVVVAWAFLFWTMRGSLEVMIRPCFVWFVVKSPIRRCRSLANFFPKNRFGR